MNYDALFRTLEEQTKQTKELLLRMQNLHTNIVAINKNIEKIAKRLAKEVKGIND